MIKKDKIYTVYCHKNKINGKMYIGVTSAPLFKRWKGGFGYRHGSNPLFESALDEYGWDAFEHLVLEENIKGRKLAFEREKHWIAHYHTWVGDEECNGYNMTPGGGYCCFVGCHHTEEAKKKISEAAKTSRKHHPTEEERLMISLRNKGYRHTEEARRKISAAGLGREMSEESKKKISEKKKGGKFSEEHKKALRKKHDSPWKHLKVYCVELNEVFENIEAASEKLNVNKNNIRKVCKGIRLTAGGYHWNFFEKRN